MKCPNCGAAKMEHDARNLPYTYKAKLVVLPQVIGYYCVACGESVLDAAQSRRVSGLMQDFCNQFDAATSRRQNGLEK